jgi:hypothetical protein
MGSQAATDAGELACQLATTALELGSRAAIGVFG